MKTHMIGNTFGRWTVLQDGGVTKSRNRLFVCRCQCGQERRITETRLKAGRARSCGCLTREMNTRHGHSPYRKASPEYRAWRAMWDRCTNPKLQNWKWYGGQGVRVCDQWEDFAVFLADVGVMPSPGMWLDRIRGGNYEPGNVRWLTAKEQQRNRRNNHMIEHEGETMCLSAWAERAGISPLLLRQRLQAGWDMSRAMSAPAWRAGRGK